MKLSEYIESNGLKQKPIAEAAGITYATFRFKLSQGKPFSDAEQIRIIQALRQMAAKAAKEIDKISV